MSLLSGVFTRKRKTFSVSLVRFLLIHVQHGMCSPGSLYSRDGASHVHMGAKLLQVPAVHHHSLTLKSQSLYMKIWQQPDSEDKDSYLFQSSRGFLDKFCKMFNVMNSNARGRPPPQTTMLPTYTLLSSWRSSTTVARSHTRVLNTDKTTLFWK